MRDEPAGHGRVQASRTSRRLALLLWLALGFVIWNVVFDLMIIDAGRAYLRHQAAWQRGNGPRVTIAGTMRPAARRAALTASVWAVLVTGSGLTATVLAGRRRRRSKGARPQDRG
jgi:hypothetical protein